MLLCISQSFTLESGELNWVFSFWEFENMGIGKKWKISVLYHRSNRSRKESPSEFICPISMSLMADPVIVSSGQTFERSCVEACIELGFNPRLKDGSFLEPSSLIPNMALKTAITNWCNEFSVPKPVAPEPQIARELVVHLQAQEEETDMKTKTQIPNQNPVAISVPEPVSLEPHIAGELVVNLQAQEEEEEENRNPVAISSESRKILDGISVKPKAKLCYAATEVNRRTHHFYSSSSESVSSVTPPLQLATKPTCYSSSASSSEIVIEHMNSISDHQLELEEHVEELITKMKNPLVSEQEEGVTSLRNLSKNDERQRETLCNPKLLSSLRPLLISRYPSIQINAVAALVNLSLEKPNKVKIVRAGAVPSLIEVLRAGQPEAQEHAAGAIFSIALDDENKNVIGVLGAIPPLLHLLKSSSERARQDAAMAIYHLSLVQSNRNKLMKAGAIQLLMGLAKGRDPSLASRVLLILCNIAASEEGRMALLDANGVQVFVRLLAESRVGEKEKEGEIQQCGKRHREAVREYCVAVLYLLSHNNLRFKGLALQAGAMELLREVAENGTERAREKAKRMLMVLKSRVVEDGCEDSAATTPARQFYRQLASGPNTTEF